MNRTKRPKKISTCEEGAVPPVITQELPKSILCGKKRRVKPVKAPEEESLKIVIQVESEEDFKIN